MHYARARSRYLVALGLPSLPVALLAIGCQPSPGAPSTTTATATRHTEAWVPTVAAEPAPQAPLPPGVGVCPHGPFCVPQPASAGAAPAAAPYEACSATMTLPKGIGPTETLGGRAPSVTFDAARTTAERAGDPGACCYKWQVLCVGGRPLRGSDGPVTAETARRDDWTADVAAIDVAAIPAATRAALAAHWEHEAAFEHASVASFARASLALLAVGAPPDLVAATHAAGIDEVEHARLTYALASAYSGAPRGPGGLPFGAMGDTTLVSVAVETFVDACAGEAAAALALREAAAGAGDATVRAILGRIAEDEERHAELAWRTVAWALLVGGEEVAGALGEAVAMLREEVAQGEGEVTEADELAVHGVLGEETRRVIRRRALVEVVLPCAEALLGQVGAEAGVAPAVVAS